MCSSALKLNLLLLWKEYPMPEGVQLNLLYIPPPTILFITNSNLHTLSLPITGRDAVIPSLSSSLYPESGGEYDAVLIICLSARLWAFSFEACSVLPAGLEGATAPAPAPLLLPKPSHRLDLLLLLHLNLALQPLKSHCFLQTDLLGQMDEALTQHLMSATNTQRRKIVYFMKITTHVRIAEWNRYEVGLNLCCKYTNMSEWCCKCELLRVRTELIMNFFFALFHRSHGLFQWSEVLYWHKLC